MLHNLYGFMFLLLGIGVFVRLGQLSDAQTIHDPHPERMSEEWMGWRGLGKRQS